MHTIRQTSGLAGFPKRDESIYDAFGAGHSSTSISAGLGKDKFTFCPFHMYQLLSIFGEIIEDVVTRILGLLCFDRYGYW